MTEKLGIKVIINTDEFNKGLKEYTDGLNKAENRTRTTTEKISSFGNTMQVALGTAIGNLVSSAIPALTRGLQSIAAQAFQVTADYERLRLSLETLTAREIVAAGGADSLVNAMGMAIPKAKDLLNWIQKIAIESPFTQEGVVIAFRTALAYGFTSEEAQRLTSAMIDFAAGTGVTTETMNRIALALGQIRAKGRLAGQEVLQLVNAGIAVDQILAKAFDKPVAEIVAMREKGLIPANDAIDAIVSSLEVDFAGAAKRQATSFAGLVSTLEDIKDVGLREFFTATFEAIQPIAVEFIDTLSSPEFMTTLRDMGNRLGKFVSRVIVSFDNIDEAIAKVMNILRILAANWSKHSTTISSTISNVAEIVSKVFEAIREIIVDDVGPQVSELITELSELFGVLGITWSDVGSVIGIAFAVLGGIIVGAIGIIIGVINGFIEILTVMVDATTDVVKIARITWENFKDFINNVFSGISLILQGKTTEGMKKLRDGITSGLKVVVGLFTMAARTIVFTLEGPIRGIQVFVETIISFFGELAEKLLNQSLPDIVNGIIGWFQTLVDIGKTLISDLVNFITGSWQQLLDNIPVWWDRITTAIETAIAGIPGAVASTVATVIQIGRDLVESIKDGIEEVWDSVINASIDTLLKGLSLAEDVIGTLNTIGSDIVNKIKDGISSAGQVVEDAINGLLDVLGISDDTIAKIRLIGGSIVDAIKAGVENAWDAFTTWISNQVLSIINDILGLIGLPGISLPEEPEPDPGKGTVQSLLGSTLMPLPTTNNNIATTMISNVSNQQIFNLNISGNFTGDIETDATNGMREIQVAAMLRR